MSAGHWNEWLGLVPALGPPMRRGSVEPRQHLGSSTEQGCRSITALCALPPNLSGTPYTGTLGGGVGGTIQPRLGPGWAPLVDRSILPAAATASLTWEGTYEVGLCSPPRSSSSQAAVTR